MKHDKAIEFLRANAYGEAADALERGPYVYIEGDNKGWVYPPGAQPTLRDRFAMAALTGICANHEICPADDEAGSWPAHYAEDAFELADACLAERAKERNDG